MQVTPELVEWLQEQITRGCKPEVMVESMIKAGYEQTFSRQIINASFASVETIIGRRPGVVSGANLDQTVQINTLGLDNNIIKTSDREIRVLLSLSSPRVVLFGNVLSDAECDELIELSRSKMERAHVVDSEKGGTRIDEARTADGAGFQVGEHPLFVTVEKRLSELVGWPVENGEGLQVLHYLVGGEYKPHFDYFDPNKNGEATQLERGGQRIATIVMYLNDVEAGGGTIFPSVGLETMPQKGSAVYFAYAGLDGSLDARSLHGGAPIIRGEKWIATKWLRQRAYV
jgi:prolyl 4-hydroxylase